MEYFAFGETFVEEHKNSINSPYKYNGKELDEESGLYYYGARYYDPRISIWASVDPLAEKFTGRSPYEYCFSNPLNLIDPTGMGPEDDPGKKGWVGRAWDTIKGWFNSNKPKTKITLGEAKWSLIGAISLETEAAAVATESTAATTAATGITESSLGILSLSLLCNKDTGQDDGQPYLYRNMKPDGLFLPDPMLGQSANTLGIRPTDVGGRTDFEQVVSPEDNQGLSVTLGIGTYRTDSVKPQDVPNFSAGKTNLWRLSPKELLPLGLIAVPQVNGTPGYTRIVPLYNMTIQTFNKRIQSTQKLWSIAPSNRN